MDLNKQPETSTSARMTEKLKEENKYLRENLKEKKESINKHFREKKVFEEIKKVDQGIVKQKDFISEDECKELLEYLRNLKNKSVGKSGFIEREEKSMIFFTFDQSELLKKLKLKIEEQEQVGKFFVNDFQPHISTFRFPVRLHADSGKNPNDIIYKNVVIPLEITYDLEKEFHAPPCTVVFKNKWFDQAALFTKQSEDNYDFIIKDKNNNFVDILNIFDFKEKIQNVSNGTFSYKGNEFLVNERFKEYIDDLSKTKRYNIRTDKHITNNKDFYKDDYEKHMTHQPYEDCQSLEIDKVVPWDIGSLISWNRSRIHCSDNFIKNNVISKTAMILFTSKNKI